MKKYFILSCIITGFLYSCNEKPIEKKPFLVEKIQNFNAIYPNWDNNDLVRDSISKIFIDSVNSWFVNDKVLEGIPVQIYEVGKADEKGETIKYGLGRLGAIYESGTLNMSLSLMITDSMANVINNDRQYYIKGKILKNLYAPEGLSRGEYDLGKYRVKVDSLFVKNK
ncbi:hypothetical protein [Sphingobacterium sp. UGAL515B_05]|uniref:hypothetical protein n=1 Tax=Sphingobacterium sp. UGAL515B_05 TaxID=2986767 RepID=UPI002954984E|nr:hypothetical protein [Sphingobacterium sp. UGAL515B_05]WON94770.1 hypothetical protein OK025_26485 [Sphingobacterium sp. UGAL515B_05]